ncbi:hypothetical protein DMH04_29185 [Kibdelosporangium aridum]|uniref:Uncharacterized protein n=1 Tax=Kibdelosporangium aridum TaxID=2030 RepID=A0A428Z440_KIBAR|nr:hypothetical protein [Kibdelosporangium aridum]RSM80968.1 hypothetical protein DMH04_29185 [Kibdelosporangium aridum]
MDYASFAVSGATSRQDTKQVHRIHLTPGPHFLTTTQDDRLDFRITDTMTVEYDHTMEGTLTGHGTNTLAVHGMPGRS